MPEFTTSCPRFLLTLITIGGLSGSGGKVIKNRKAVVICAWAKPPAGRKLVETCTLAAREFPAIVITSTKCGVVIVVVVVIAEITDTIKVVKVGIRKTCICGPVVAVIILCEYSRTIGENKSGENATLDSRFCSGEIL